MRILSPDVSARRVTRDLAVVAVVLLAAYLGVRRFAPYLLDAAGFREFVAGFGPWAPVAYVAVQAAQVVAAPVPGQVVGFAGGYLFGTLPATAYSLVGVAIGSYAAYALTDRTSSRWSTPG